MLNKEQNFFFYIISRIMVKEVALNKDPLYLWDLLDDVLKMDLSLGFTKFVTYPKQH